MVCYTEINKEGKEWKQVMGMQQDALQYRGSIYLDGYTYRLSLRFHEGQQQTIEVPHMHPQYELHVVFSGEVMLEQEGLPSTILRTGDCCLVSPLVYHLRRCGSDQTKCCALYIDSPKGAPLCAAKKNAVNLVCAAVMMEYLRGIEAEISGRNISADSSLQCLFTLLLISLIRELNKQPPERPLTVHTTISQQREETIDNYFASHYGQNICARNLADYLGITTRQLARIMQKRYACTFRQHLQEIRLYHARQQLIHSERTILEIANDCGFTDQGAFSVAFRNTIGCTPSQYRQQQRKYF